MTTQAQYASIPKLGKVTIAVANTLRDGTGDMGTLLVASPAAMSGTRVDKIQMQALGDTTAGMLRFFLVRGAPGVQISSITFSGTTATVTTTVAHGLTTGDSVTIQNAMPDQYNVVNAVAAVVNATSFTYQMLAAPMNNAIAVGAFSTVKAGEVPQFWRETTVSPATVTARSITSITASSNTATMTTSAPHGLTTGDIVVVTGATPAAYNGTYAITFTGANTFTFVMATAPGANAAIVGTYSVIKVSFSKAMFAGNSSDGGHLPLVLPAGWQLRVATNNANTFSVTATFAGDMQ